MSKITVIQLLNKIANGEEVPNKIRINETLYWFDDRQKQYIYVPNEKITGCDDIYSNTLILTYEPFDVLDEFLNTEVEIIEDNKEIAGKKHVENNVNFGVLINELRYYREHLWNEIEDKKIPEKITVQDLLDLDTGSLLKRIVDNQNELIDEINKLKENK